MIANRAFQLPMQNSGSGASIFRLLGVDWLPVTAFVQDAGVSVLLGMSGNSPFNVFAVGQNYPSGAASSFGFVAHLDGEVWRGVELPDDVKVTRLFTDVAVGPPGLPNGAYVTPDAIFDGTTWTTSTDPVAGALLTVDLRGDEMWAAGYDGIIVRWTGSGWAISHPFGSQP